MPAEPARGNERNFGALSSAPIAQRLAWITGLRLAFLTILLVATAFLYLQGELSAYPQSLRVVFVTIASGYALAAMYAAILRSVSELRPLAYAQIVLDQITWTAIVYVTGGPTSGATSFYALTCLVGAILVGLRGAALAAVVGIAIYASLCAAFRWGWVLPPHDQAAVGYVVNAKDLVYPLLVNALGISVVSLLAGYLAERLRVTGGALADAQERAERAERLAVLGRVAAGLAHEIRNPLGSIRGSIELLRESSGLTDEDKHLCDIVHREAGRLANLVDDMMDLSKPRAPRAEAVDVAKLAREVVALAARADRSGDVAVEYVGPDEPTMARCDGAQMRQVLWNLVRNAVQASAAGSSVTVRVERERAAREVVLSVEDHGTGVSSEDAPKIFDAFYTTRSHGVGIGLAVVKRIIDEHGSMGARIEVDGGAGGRGGESGSGARFRVTLSSDLSGLRKSSPPAP